MGRRRERTSWSRVDFLHQERRGAQGGRVRLRPRRNSTSTVVAKLQPKVIEKELISEFSCVEVELLEEEFSHGFTKIRSKNLDIIFKRDFYKKKKMMMTNPGGWQETSDHQPAVSFDQLDLDEIPEFRPRMSSEDSGYSSSFPEVQCPPHCPQYPPYHHQTGPQFYLYSPFGNTLIPCEEIILSLPGGPVYPEVYQTPTEAYVAYPVQGPAGPGYITQPFTGPEISSSPSTPSEDPGELQGPGESLQRSQSEQGDRRGSVKQTQPGVKQSCKDVVPARYIPGLAVENKTKKRRKKKPKSKHSTDQSRSSLSSSESEAREVRKDVEVTEDLFSFQHFEASETEVRLTDDLTNSLVNPPTDEEEAEIPTNAQFSYHEAVSKSPKEILSPPSSKESATPPEADEAGEEKPPKKPSIVEKLKNKTRQKKPKRSKVTVDKETDPVIPPPSKKLDVGKIEINPTDSKVCTESASETPQALESEEVKDKAASTVETEEETATTKEPVTLEEFETKTRADPSTPVKPSRERKKKGRGRRIQTSQPPLKPILVNDDEVGVLHCQTTGGDESLLVSRSDLVLVVDQLGHGMTRGVMDLERPFLGSFVPPDHHQHQDNLLESSNTPTSTAVLESQKLEAEQNFKE